MKTEPDHPDVGRYEYVVRDVAEPDLGIRAWDGPETSLRSRGHGQLKSRASDGIEERVDLGAHVGEHVATVSVDVDTSRLIVEGSDTE